MIAWNFQRIVGTCQFRVPWFGYPCGYSSLTINSDFSELEEYEDLQIYGVFAVMACCTFVVVTLMQIVVLSQNAYIKKLNDMYSDGKDC